MTPRLQGIMFDDDDEGVSGRLWALIVERFNFSFMSPVWIIRRPESLTITDYRPTFLMLFTGAGFLTFVVLFVLLAMKFGNQASIGLWVCGLIAATCLVLAFRGSIREVYHFDTTTESYSLVRQFIYRKEVIEGSLGQFTGAYVKTVTGDEGGSAYFVVLQQEGMFLTGVTEQTLREEVPIFNSFDNEGRIASAISGILATRVRKAQEPNRA